LGLLVAIALAATIEVGRRTAAYIHIHDDPNRKEQLVAISVTLQNAASLATSQ
jgi:hypothetical protein